MAAHCAVARGEHGCATRPPRLDDAVDRRRRDVRPVAEDDDGSFGLRAQRVQAAPERCAGPPTPIGAANDALRGLDLVRAGDDDELVDRARADALEYRIEEQPLLRRSEPRGCAGREDDGSDQETSTVIDSTTTGCVGSSVLGSPRRPIRCTTFMPEVTLPITA